MARLSKETRRHLERILSDMDRGLAYIDRHDVRLCRTLKPENALCTDFTRPPVTDGLREHVLGPDDRNAPDYALATVCKHIGSDIAGLRRARLTLREFLEPEMQA